MVGLCFNMVGALWLYNDIYRCVFLEVVAGYNIGSKKFKKKLVVSSYWNNALDFSLNPRQALCFYFLCNLSWIHAIWSTSKTMKIDSLSNCHLVLIIIHSFSHTQPIVLSNSISYSFLTIQSSTAVHIRCHLQCNSSTVHTEVAFSENLWQFISDVVFIRNLRLFFRGPTSGSNLWCKQPTYEEEASACNNS